MNSVKVGCGMISTLQKVDRDYVRCSQDTIVNVKCDSFFEISVSICVAFAETAFQKSTRCAFVSLQKRKGNEKSTWRSRGFFIIACSISMT